MFPEASRRALPHRRRDAVVLPRDRSLSRGDRTIGDAARCCCRRSSESSSTTCAARASASRVDPRDGLLPQGAEGYQLTWMDAKVGDWVVTPRRGKAVEINALWYNALRLLDVGCAKTATRAARPLGERADARSRESFNRRFWYRRRRLSLRRRRRRARRRRRRAGRTRCSRSRCPIRCWTSRRWAAVLDVVTDGCSRRSGCARWRPAIPTIRRNTTAIFAPATPPITRARSGRG